MATSPLPQKPDWSFQEWWDNEGTWVESPNERRGGYSGVQLVERGGQTLYCKRQTNHPYYSWRHPFGEPTILREARASMALRRLDIEVPNIVFCGTRKIDGESQALLVTDKLPDFCSLDEWYAGINQDWDEAIQQQVAVVIGAMVARMHLGRWQHSCLYPKHIFVRVTAHNGMPTITAALLDLEKCRRRLFARNAARRDLWQLYRHRDAMPDAHWSRLITSYREWVAGRFHLAASDRKKLRYPSS